MVPNNIKGNGPSALLDPDNWQDTNDLVFCPVFNRWVDKTNPFDSTFKDIWNEIEKFPEASVENSDNNTTADENTMYFGDIIDERALLSSPTIIQDTIANRKSTRTVTIAEAVEEMRDDLANMPEHADTTPEMQHQDCSNSVENGVFALNKQLHDSACALTLDHGDSSQLQYHAQALDNSYVTSNVMQQNCVNAVKLIQRTIELSNKLHHPSPVRPSFNIPGFSINSPGYTPTHGVPQHSLVQQQLALTPTKQLLEASYDFATYKEAPAELSATNLAPALGFSETPIFRVSVASSNRNNSSFDSNTGSRKSSQGQPSSPVHTDLVMQEVSIGENVFTPTFNHEICALEEIRSPSPAKNTIPVARYASPSRSSKQKKTSVSMTSTPTVAPFQHIEPSTMSLSQHVESAIIYVESMKGNAREVERSGTELQKKAFSLVQKSLESLKERCKDVGIKSSGVKREKIRRLLAYGLEEEGMFATTRIKLPSKRKHQNNDDSQEELTSPVTTLQKNRGCAVMTHQTSSSTTLSLTTKATKKVKKAREGKGQ